MSWIVMGDGALFDYREPHKFKFDAWTVATSLSRINRFLGHTKWPYTVAQHSVLMAREAVKWALGLPNKQSSDWPRRAALIALLHDVPETVIGDIPGPFKKYLTYSMAYGPIGDVEEFVNRQLVDCHELAKGSLYDEWLANLDLRMLLTEARDLMLNNTWVFDHKALPLDIRVEPWDREYARDEWMRQYTELTSDE